MSDKTPTPEDVAAVLNKDDATPTDEPKDDTQENVNPDEPAGPDDSEDDGAEDDPDAPAPIVHLVGDTFEPINNR